MVREIITINVGQAGIQLSESIWSQYGAEHGIDNNGKMEEKTNDDSFHVFYEDTESGSLVPRNISVDLEPNVIDDVKNGIHGSLFNPLYLINGKEDAANNFARGFYTVGRDIIDKVNEKIRKLSDKCENLQGFIINHSVGGGTGSGLGSLILERLSIDYKRKSKLGFEIYPSLKYSDCVVEPYNALLSTNWLIDYTSISCILDNEAMYGICQNNLNIRHPSFTNLNNLVCKVISSVTASLRFEGELNIDINDLQTNLVPYPRMHFMTTSMAPILTPNKKDTFSNNVQNITNLCLNSNNFFVKLEDFDPDIDQYMAILLNYRGNIKSADTSNTIQWLKNNNKCKLVDWSPSGFKIGLNEKSLNILDNDDMAYFDNNATMIANNCGITKVFDQRILQKYDLMYSQRTFVHWYVGEGMEEGEFTEARENLEFLQKDYLDCLKEDDTDNDDNDKDNDTDDDDF